MLKHWTFIPQFRILHFFDIYVGLCRSLGRFPKSLPGVLQVYQWSCADFFAEFFRFSHKVVPVFSGKDAEKLVFIGKIYYDMGGYFLSAICR